MGRHRLCEPNSEIDMAGRFLPTVDSTQDHDDTKFSYGRHPVAALQCIDAIFSGLESFDVNF